VKSLALGMEVWRSGHSLILKTGCISILEDPPDPSAEKHLEC